jgi:hypothetical protein
MLAQMVAAAAKKRESLVLSMLFVFRQLFKTLCHMFGCSVKNEFRMANGEWELTVMRF